MKITSINLFRNPAGNGITRQIARAKHQVTVTKLQDRSRRAAEAGFAAGLVAAFFSACDFAVSIPAILMGTALGNCVGHKNSKKYIEAQKKSEKLQNSDEYKQITERLSRIKK